MSRVSTALIQIFYAIIYIGGELYTLRKCDPYIGGELAIWSISIKFVGE